MTPASPGLSASASASFSRTESSPVDDAGGAETETWSKKVYAALPLFIVGGACLAVAVELYSSGTTANFGGNGAARLYPWALFLALGVTGFAAGTFALLAEDEPTPTVAVEAASPPPSPTSAAWDESTIAPAKSGYVRPRTWERYPELPTEVGWSTPVPRVEAVPPDVVLVQIDEIAASLRRKPPPPLNVRGVPGRPSG